MRRSGSGLSRRDVLFGGGAAAAVLALPGSAHALRIPQPILSIPGVDDVPLTDLHRHLEAGMSAEMVAFLAEQNRVTQVVTRNGRRVIEGIDIQDPESIERYMGRAQGEFAGNFRVFADSLGVGLGVIKTLDDLIFVTREQILEQQMAGNIHTELRGSPYTYQQAVEEMEGIVPMVDIIEAIRIGVAEARALGASGSYIACFSRNKGAQYGKAVVDAVLSTYDPNDPIGIDIAGGPEHPYPPAMFTRLMAPVREAGIPVTVHSGEQDDYPFEKAPATFVRDAIELLGATRIGHGTSLMADPETLALARDRGVTVEVCPVSNHWLDYVRVGHHPLRMFLDERLKVTLCTDDPLQFGTNSTRDIVDRYGETLMLDLADLAKMTLNGIDAAVLAAPAKAALRREFLDGLHVGVKHDAHL